MPSKLPTINNFTIFETSIGKIGIKVFFRNKTLWLTQKAMARLFDVEVNTISEHLTNIFKTKELAEKATVRKFRIVQKEGKREVNRELEYYNLDAIISVGYRVNSNQAIEFRTWAQKKLKE